MNPFEMVIGIVLICGVVGLVQTWIKARGEGHSARGGAEEAQLRAEVRQLKDRLAVLERIAVEKENSLEREFARLRDEEQA